MFQGKTPAAQRESVTSPATFEFLLTAEIVELKKISVVVVVVGKIESESRKIV